MLKVAGPRAAVNGTRPSAIAVAAGHGAVGDVADIPAAGIIRASDCTGRAIGVAALYAPRAAVLRG